ncbi:MAG: RNA methyltransferase [Desulfatiglandaceae bacterium]
MKIREILSRDNPTFKTWLQIRRARGIKKQGLALLAGPKPVHEVLAAFPHRCAGIIFTSHHQPPSVPPGLPRYRLSPDLFHLLDLFDTGRPLLLVRLDPFPPFAPEQCPSGCTVCIPFQDPANVGAVIRTAAALGAAQIVILKEAAHPFHPKSLRSAGSTLFKIPILEGPSINRLDTGEVPLITLSPNGVDLRDFQFPSTFCLLPGLEGPGLPGSVRPSAQLAIPMDRDVDSLNSATATAISLYCWRKGR